MLGDARVAQAKRLHQQASKLLSDAETARAKRDRLIREVYASGGWSYKRLSQRVGCSPELIAYIVRHAP